MRRLLVVAVTAALVGVPAVVARATIDHCPVGVSDVTGGSNPSLAQVSSWLTASAAAHAVPVSVLKVVAYKESTWRQYADDGTPLVSTDAHCGLGIMQVTADTRDDAVRLANDPAYNIDEGAKILAEKYAGAQGTPPADTGQADDPDVIENWYYAICLYNGCSGDPTYANAAADILADPFRRLPLSFRQYMPPAGFTKPTDADPSYVFPSAFQARHSPDVFVFYDSATGAVTKTVPIRTHLASAPPVVKYPAVTYGPDMQQVSCVQCSGWRLAEGVGLSGRAHWTNTVTGASQSTATWAMPLNMPQNEGPGRYRIEAFVPSMPDTLGSVTYTINGVARAVDQNAWKGKWVGIAETTYSSPVSVVLGDSSSVAGKKIVADGVRQLPVPRVSLSADPPWNSVYYGQSAKLTVNIRRVNGNPLSYGQVAIYRRPRGGSSWTGAGIWTTNSQGNTSVTVKPSASTEYTARYIPSNGQVQARAASNNLLLSIIPTVTIHFSDTALHRGEYETVTTSIGPNHAGQVVYLQRHYGTNWETGWKTIASAKLSSSSTASWRFQVPVTSEQIVNFKIYKPADADHAATATDGSAGIRAYPT